MSKKININVTDNAKAFDNCNLNIEGRIKAGPKKTKVTLVNSNTGETLGVFENKLCITGSQYNAMRAFGIQTAGVEFPNYNDEMKLDNTTTVAPKNEPIVCLFCVSDTGCGSTPKDVKVSSYTDRIAPCPVNPSNVSEFNSNMIMPFRFVDKENDLNDDLRKYYFGKKSFDILGKIGYYFKTFDTEPQLYVRYADGTPITPEMYNVHSEQTAECYIHTRLRITSLDFRDYFEQVLGWDKARISSLSLCYAWYDDTIDDYVYYQDITPYTILYFSYQWLVDANVAIDILYDIYY